MSTKQGLNSTRTQDINRLTLLRLLREGGIHSRASLARRSGLSPSAVSRLTAALVDEGYIVETDEVRETNTRGRKGRAVALNADFSAALGLEVTDLAVGGLAVDFSGGIYASHTAELASNAQETVVAAIFKTIEALQGERSGPRIESIVIASHGVVDPDSGTLLTFPGNHSWKPLDIASIVTEAFGIDAAVEFRIHAATKGRVELAEENWSDASFLYLDTAPGNSFGVGIVTDGHIVRGSHGLAGQFAHLRVSTDETQCFCGSHGCLVTVASPEAIVRRARTALHQGVESSLHAVDALQFLHIAEAAATGDKLSIGLIEEAGSYLGLAFSYLLNALNPERVIIGGTLAAGGSLLIDPIKRSARRHTVSHVFSGTKWELSTVEWNPAAYGAAYTGLDRFFDGKGSASEEERIHA